MTDDLHDIDDLFRDGLEGHEEEVPQSVWQGVSNDLDKRQASFYKRKYFRLRRIALAFLFLFFISAGYFIFETLNEKRKTSGKGKVDVTMQTTKQHEKGTIQNSPLDKKNAVHEEPEQSIDDDTINNKPVSSLPSLTEKDLEKGEKKEPVREAISDNTVLPTNKEIADKTNNHLKNKNERSRSVRLRSRVLDGIKIKHSRSAETMTDKQNKPNTNKPVINPETASIPSLPLAYFPLLEQSHNLPEIMLPDFGQNQLLSLPQDKLSKAAKTGKANRFSVSAFVAPNFSFDRLEDDGRLAGPGRNRRDAHRDEKENISFSAGLLLNYDVSKNWRLQTGIGFSTSSASVAPKTVYALTDNNGHTHYELHCSSGYVYLSPKDGAPPAPGDSAQTLGTRFKLSYVNIPVLVSYQVNKGRFTLLPTIGAGFNILTSNNTTTSLMKGAASESTSANISGLKPGYVDGYIGLGIEYGLARKLSIGLRPKARIAFTSINQQTPVRSYENSFSVEAGVRIKL